MTFEEVKLTFIERDGHTFTPITEENNGFYTIIKTSEDIYNDWINQKNSPILKSEIEILQEKTMLQDGAIMELAEIISTLGGV